MCIFSSIFLCVERSEVISVSALLGVAVIFYDHLTANDLAPGNLEKVGYESGTQTDLYQGTKSFPGVSVEELFLSLHKWRSDCLSRCFYRRSLKSFFLGLKVFLVLASYLIFCLRTTTGIRIVFEIILQAQCWSAKTKCKQSAKCFQTRRETVERSIWHHSQVSNICVLSKWNCDDMNVKPFLGCFPVYSAGIIRDWKETIHLLLLKQYFFQNVVSVYW